MSIWDTFETLSFFSSEVDVAQYKNTRLRGYVEDSESSTPESDGMQILFNAFLSMFLVDIPDGSGKAHMDPELIVARRF